MWSLVTPEAKMVIGWPDGAVLYDARTTTTTMLSPAAGAIVAHLKVRPADVDALAASQAEADVPIAELLDTLTRYGIVCSTG
jgi:PqqD family protein of HPr-rel-A system